MNPYGYMVARVPARQSGEGDSVTVSPMRVYNMPKKSFKVSHYTFIIMYELDGILRPVRQLVSSIYI